MREKVNDSLHLRIMRKDEEHIALRFSELSVLDSLDGLITVLDKHGVKERLILLSTLLGVKCPNLCGARANDGFAAAAEMILEA
jgi:hypothetical protein